MMIDKRCTITIEYGHYKWRAVVQADNETFLVHEYTDGKAFNVYSIHEDNLEDHILKVLEGSV